MAWAIRDPATGKMVWCDKTSHPLIVAERARMTASFNRLYAAAIALKKSQGRPSVTQYPDLFAALAAPFEPSEVKQRQAAGGRRLDYITARTAMNRLDGVLGPENWWDAYEPGEHSVVCRLSIRLPDGQVLTKADAGGYAGMSDQGDDDKSGFSDAFKRACVKFGVSRYLYRDGVPAFVPEREPAPASEPAANGNVPRTGKALFAWTRKQEDDGTAGVLRYLNDWGKREGYPARMIEWSEDQVAAAYAEGSRMVRASG